MYLWIGGAPAAGKTTIARRLAIDCDLRVYHADHRLRAHHLRDPLPPIDPKLSAHELKARFLAASTQRLSLILDDLASAPFERPTVVEGPLLRPSEISGPGVWLIPSEPFHRLRLEERQTHPLIVERNLLLADALRVEAGERALIVDGNADVDAMYERVTQRFADVLAALPPATNEQRRAVRRDANAWRLAAAHAEAEHDAHALDRTSFACECARPSCHRRSELQLDEYGRLVAADVFLDTHER